MPSWKYRKRTTVGYRLKSYTGRWRVMMGVVYYVGVVRNAYTLVLHKQGAKLYTMLKEVISSHLVTEVSTTLLLLLSLLLSLLLLLL